MSTNEKGPRPTPGPWQVRVQTFASARAAAADVRRMLCNAPGFDPDASVDITVVVAPDILPDPPPDSDGTVVISLLGNGPTSALNAALIAAAPDMLAALEAAHDALEEMACEDCGCEGSNPACRVLDDVNAAIAKAKGGAA